MVSKEDSKIFNIEKGERKKIKIIPLGLNLKKKTYKFKKNSADIIFIGNINYHPNKIACYEFVKEIMPVLEQRGFKINFKIIGQTSKLLKLSLSRFKKVSIFESTLTS